ncbi:alpha/beta hydrolase [Leuconostoc litchii]|uniref:Alpha/beta hydrolase n=1 Tax=Leuconostoc litchii TaxID=1981069 RepID=A0A6P2CMI4_9LACO|nr:alpha/beta hydrolase [Leuconostoc litchii]TYC46137.1 alpha/beta hydrolase [Leuconostoc litchii]
MLFKDKTYKYIPATVPEKVKIFADVRYAVGERNKLDIYVPEGYENCPIIIDIYGGGMIRGQKSSHKLNPSLRFLHDGFAIVSPDYSFNTVGKRTFPVQIAEMRAVLNFLIQNSDKYGIDRENITLIGESSGAQIALLTAATISESLLLGRIADSTEHTSFPKINSVIGMYGPYKVDEFSKQFAQLNITPQFSETGEAQSFEGIMLGTRRPDKSLSRVLQADPANYFSKNMPPLLLIAGTKDDVVPYLQSVSLAEKYQKKVGKVAEIILIENAHHGPIDFDTSEIYDKKLNFIQRYTK